MKAQHQHSKELEICDLDARRFRAVTEVVTGRLGIDSIYAIIWLRPARCNARRISWRPESWLGCNIHAAPPAPEDLPKTNMPEFCENLNLVILHRTSPCCSAQGSAESRLA